MKLKPLGVIRTGVFLLGAAVLSGCYTYVPADAPRPGEVARVRVPVRSALDDPNAPPPTATVEGEVLAAGDTIVLATTSRRELGAYRELILVDTFRVARGDVSSIELRKFSQGRSVALGVALAGTVTIAALAALGITGGAEGEGTPPDVPNPEGAIVLNPVVQLLWRLISR